MNLLTCFYAFMTALAAALVMVPFLRHWALDQKNLDAPDERKVHTTPTPRLGGIAIFLAFLLAAIVFAPIDPRVRGLLAGALIMFVTGVVDDLNGISSRFKFAGEVVACLTAVLVGQLWISNLGDLFGTGNLILPDWAGVVFTVFALVGVINAINLIDGLDGLAGGIAVITLVTFMLLGLLDDAPAVLLLSAALLGALLGFLKYNFYPAQIFMGDAGSLTLGFILGFLAIMLTQRPGSTVSPVVPLMVLGLPIVDTLWVMGRRVLRGLSPFVADRGHVHHKFLDLGFEHRFTVLLIYGVTLFWACFAVALHALPDYLLLLIFVGSAGLGYFSLRHVLRHPDRFPWLRRDSAAGLYKSETYRKMVSLVEHGVPVICLSLALYLLLAAWSLFLHNGIPLQVALLLLAAGVLLWLRPLTDNRQFLMLVVYAAAGMAATEVWHAGETLAGSVTVKRAGDILLGTAGVLALLKIQFRRNNEFFLSSADFLALAVIIFLAIGTEYSLLGLQMNGPLLRSLVAIVAIRVIAFRSVRYRRTVIAAGLGYLFLAVVL